ncbi:MAG: amino acid ABC transporter substrate-binding protein [Oligoflexia bacterium]|nr:amino acid ABC transporter substrate-binding protein [Oligoflexia bacterium]
MIKIALLIILFIFNNTLYSREPIYDVAFYSYHKPPLVILDKDGKYNGGYYYDIATKVLNEAEIKFKLLPLPKNRARIVFANGEVKISCCDNPQWRQRPEEIKVQLFSKPIGKVSDVYVINKKIPLNEKNIYNNHYALIRGYTYKSSEKFKKVSRLANEKDLLDFLNIGRANIIIINKRIANHFMRYSKYKNLKVYKTFSEDSIHIRVNKSLKHLLTRINKAIDKIYQKE